MVPSTATYRILDAAANRAGEGLRVVEEYARFGLNDAHLSRLLKECRHELTTALAVIPESSRLAARDTLGDVGTSIGTAAEYQRGTVLDVVRASFKRVQEALRTLEEYGKLIQPIAGSPAFAPRIEQVRYRIYTAEKLVLRTATSVERFHDRNLYLLVTGTSCLHGLETTVHAAIAAGVRIIQLREKQLADRALLEQARRLRDWTATADVLLIINDRPDIAVLAEADGVHVGQDELTVRDARQIVGPDRLIGVSTHTIDQARQAVLDGADYLGVGPTFPSGTKSFDHFAGLDFVRQVAAEITLPWFAIGGIDVTNVDSVIQAGGTRVAVSSAVCSAADPSQAAAGLVRQLRRPADSLEKPG
ncbi:MAG: thiamine phosphate synthase [Planctomycetes bacterium]|nr:thiamine phosphate synthase [Planctomycetota bacterium]